MSELLFVVGVAVLLVALGLARARPPARPAAPPARRVPAPERRSSLGRAVDPDDPDGAFMDGYVSGRYAERWARPGAAAGGVTGGALAGGAVGPGAWADEDDTEEGLDVWDGPTGWNGGHAHGYDQADHPDDGDDMDDW